MTGASLPRRTIDVLSTPVALAAAAADRFVAIAADAQRARGEFIVALAGGSTPRALYSLLASPAYAAKVDWPHVHVLWSDERCVPPDDEASNYRMAHETLLGRVPVEARNVHRIRGEDGAGSAATAYEQIVRTVLRTPDGPPLTAHGARIDLVLLGMGEDGHTASLLPGMLPAGDANRWVAAIPATPIARVTLTPALINAAADIVFVVSGAAKAAIVGRMLNEPRAHGPLPVQLIAPTNGRVHWMIDAAAATALGPESRT